MPFIWCEPSLDLDLCTPFQSFCSWMTSLETSPSSGTNIYLAISPMALWHERSWIRNIACDLSWLQSMPPHLSWCKESERILSECYGTQLNSHSDLLHTNRDSFRNPVVAFDCETQEEVLIQGYPLFSAADNPMQAEQCSCQLQNANFFCRTCLAGGSTEFKQSEVGYARLFQVCRFSCSLA